MEKEKINLILNIIIFILLLTIVIYAAVYFDVWKNIGVNPCSACMNKTGATCFLPQK